VIRRSLFVARSAYDVKTSIQVGWRLHRGCLKVLPNKKVDKHGFLSKFLLFSSKISFFVAEYEKSPFFFKFFNFLVDSYRYTVIVIYNSIAF